MSATSTPEGVTSPRGGVAAVHAAGVAGLVLVAAATVGLGIAPLRARAEAARAAGIEARILAEDLERQRVRAEAVDRRLAAAEAALQDVRLEVRPVSALNRRFADVIDLATACGIRVTESRTDEAQADEWFVRVPIRIVGTGPAAGVDELLARLRRELPDVEVLAFEIVRIPGGEGSATSLVVDLAWYAASDEAATPSPG